MSKTKRHMEVSIGGTRKKKEPRKNYSICQNKKKRQRQNYANSPLINLILGNILVPYLIIFPFSSFIFLNSFNVTFPLKNMI